MSTSHRVHPATQLIGEEQYGSETEQKTFMLKVLYFLEAGKTEAPPSFVAH